MIEVIQLSNYVLSIYNYLSIILTYSISYGPLRVPTVDCLNMNK
jgi:hypothetical protein